MRSRLERKVEVMWIGAAVALAIVGALRLFGQV
jgi:hypothetical protein